MKRRRVRAWWGRRPWKERPYDLNTALHHYEDEIVLRKIREMEPARARYWVFTAKHLMNTHPDTFVNEKRLLRVLQRLQSRPNFRRPRKWGPNPIWELDDRPAKKKAKKAA